MIKSNDREIVLFHDTMKVALALPGAGINRSPVIDRSGYIRSILVKKDGEWEEQCSYPLHVNPENMEKPCGICAVLDSDFGGDGNIFRLGVGKVGRQDYGAPPHWGSKKVIPFDKRWSYGNRWVTFITQTGEWDGYSAVQEKTVSLEENKIFIKTHMKNTGKRSFTVIESYYDKFIQKEPTQEVIRNVIGVNDCVTWERCWEF